MPYHDEEYPGQSLWQSVLLFCCKGMIEGIMVVLFFWLLVQVLFTKQLEVHLQVLLLVGLIIFCLCLVLGCFLCWKNSDIGVENKPLVTPASTPAEPVTFGPPLPPSAATAASRLQYEELDGDTLEYPSTFTSPAPSVLEFTPRSFSNQENTIEEKDPPKSYFSLRRLSSPLVTTPIYKPIEPTSLPAFPKLGLFVRTCKALQRRCTATEDNTPYDEHSRLTSPSAVSPNEKPIPLAPLNYGSDASRQQPTTAKPCLHFTMAFSPEQQTLAVTVINLTGMPHRLQDVYVLGSLPPLHPCPIQASVQNSISSKAQSLVLFLKVSSVKELQRCVLRIAVYARDQQSLRGTAVGQLEAKCGGTDWGPDNLFHFSVELNTSKVEMEKTLISQDVLIYKGLNCPPQIFILLHYQPLAHCVKATVLRADNLRSLTNTSAGGDYQVVINLHHEGHLINSKETKAESSTKWNTSFVFDLPTGDISQLSLMLEFVIMKKPLLSKGEVVGRVLIGTDAAEAGRAHWKDMCSLQVELARWHVVQPELL